MLYEGHRLIERIFGGVPDAVLVAEVVMGKVWRIFAMQIVGLRIAGYLGRGFCRHFNRQSV